MRPIWLGTKPPLNQRAPSLPCAMLPPSSAGVTPDAAAEYDVTIGSPGPGVGAGAGAGAGGGGGGAGGGGCGVFDESITLLPEKTVWSAPPPHAVRLAARAATSWRRNDTSMARNRTGAPATRMPMLQAIAFNATVRTMLPEARDAANSNPEIAAGRAADLSYA